jgi:hypothetical protein
VLDLAFSSFEVLNNFYCFRPLKSIFHFSFLKMPKGEGLTKLYHLSSDLADIVGKVILELVNFLEKLWFASFIDKKCF